MTVNLHFAGTRVTRGDDKDHTLYIIIPKTPDNVVVRYWDRSDRHSPAALKPGTTVDIPYIFTTASDAEQQALQAMGSEGDGVIVATNPDAYLLVVYNDGVQKRNDNKLKWMYNQ